jgi:hypothetical protein
MCGTIDLFLAHSDPDAANRFLDRLAALARGDWLEAADRLRRRGDRSTSVALLDAVIAHHGLSVEAWYATDGVETAASHVFDDLAHRPAAEQALARSACAAASVAALALLARGLISPEHFEALYHPFATAIPALSVVSR